MASGQGLPVQLIYHAKPYQNLNFRMMVLLNTLVYDSENYDLVLL